MYKGKQRKEKERKDGEKKGRKEREKEKKEGRDGGRE